MKPSELALLLRRIVRQPTAPYFEDAVRAEVEAVLAEHSIEVERDRFGNVLAHLRTAPELRPLVLAAHMDHPGFRLDRRVSGGRWLATFRGGVPPAYFKKGTALRVFPGATPATLGPRHDGEKSYHIDAPDSIGDPRFAMWDLPAFSIRNGRIVSRACDDLVGTACAVATLIRLKQSRAKVNVIAALCRAEEVGFHGALALASEKGLPENSLVISLETSRELPPVRQGEGVILRVGDKASTFDHAAGAFLAEVAGELARRRPGFRFQRALMSGGTCEATAYQHFGYQTTAVCVALRNYHNCGLNNRIAAENVHLGDATCMVNLLACTAREMPRYEELSGRIATRLKKLLEEARTALLART